MISALKKLVLAPSALALALASPAGAEEPAANAPQGPALWKIADDDTIIYLFGTVHILPKNNDWLTGSVKQAFESSDTLVTEARLDDAAAQGQRIMAAALLPEGQTLRSLMSDEDRAEYEAGMARLELPAEAFDRFDPWFAAANIGAIVPLRRGYASDSGADAVLTRSAGEKPIEGLESIDFQVAMFDDLPLDQQLGMLDRTIEWLPLSGDLLDLMVLHWLEGDIDGVAAMVNFGFSDPVMRKQLVTDRNADWAEWIDRRLDRPGTVFMAVGAGHLAGKGSVQEFLAERGIESTRVN